MRISRTNVASVGSAFNYTRKVKVLSLPETIKEKSRFRAKALRRELVLLPIPTTVAVILKIVLNTKPHTRFVRHNCIEMNDICCRHLLCMPTYCTMFVKIHGTLRGFLCDINYPPFQIITDVVL